MQLVRNSGEIGVQLQCFWNTIAMVLGRKRLFLEKQGEEIRKNTSKCRYFFARMCFEYFCKDIKQNEKCLR